MLIANLFTSFFSGKNKENILTQKVLNMTTANDILNFYTRHMIVVGYYGFTSDVRVSVHLSIRLSVVRPSIHPFFISRR